MLTSGEHCNHAHHLPTVLGMFLKRPLKACSEIASSFISMYVIKALFVCFPAMLQLKTFCKALGCVYCCTWVTETCFCLRTKETMFLFKAVLCSDSPLSVKSDSTLKLEERKKAVAGKRGSHRCMCGCEEASRPLKELQRT